MNTATVSPAPKLFAIALGIVLTIAAPQFADKWMLYLWNFVTGSLTLHAVASLPSGTSAAGAGQIGPWGGLPRGPPGGIGTPGINPASTALGPARAAAEREAQQGVGEQLAGLLARAVRAMRYDDASARTNQEGKTSSGTAVDSDSFENATWLAVLVDAAVGSIPGVGTIIGVYDAYGVLTDADSTTGDRVYAVISVLPGGKIVKILARSEIVQSGIQQVQKRGARGAERLLIKASVLEKWAQKQGWTRTQTATGPIKYVDENGVVRATIKRGSARTPGSETPHVELRNAAGERIDPAGSPVTRRSLGNHTRVDWDLD